MDYLSNKTISWRGMRLACSAFIYMPDVVFQFVLIMLDEVGSQFS